MPAKKYASRTLHSGWRKFSCDAVLCRCHPSAFPCFVSACSASRSWSPRSFGSWPPSSARGAARGPVNGLLLLIVYVAVRIRGGGRPRTRPRARGRRSYGLRPSPSSWRGAGGLTSYAGGGLTRERHIAVTLAGPAAGFHPLSSRAACCPYPTSAFGADGFPGTGAFLWAAALTFLADIHLLLDAPEPAAHPAPRRRADPARRARPARLRDRAPRRHRGCRDGGGPLPGARTGGPRAAVRLPGLRQPPGQPARPAPVAWTAAAGGSPRARAWSLLESPQTVPLFRRRSGVSNPTPALDHVQTALRRSRCRLSVRRRSAARAGTCRRAHGRCPTTAAAPSPEPKSGAVENSVVKIFATVRYPDPYKPWSKQAPHDITGSGAVIEGRRIITNAHVVLYRQPDPGCSPTGARGQALRHRRGRRPRHRPWPCSSWTTTASSTHTRPCPWPTSCPASRTPSWSTATRKGARRSPSPRASSRASSSSATTSPPTALRIQIDAAINPGNSGGPAVAGDHMMGLAFSRLQGGAENIGYLIPAEEIDLFLKDIADGKYDGKPALHDRYPDAGKPGPAVLPQAGQEHRGRHHPRARERRRGLPAQGVGRGHQDRRYARGRPGPDPACRAA